MVKRFALALALACLLSGTVLAGDIHDVGAPAPGEIPSTGAPAPSDDTTAADIVSTIVLTILS